MLDDTPESHTSLKEKRSLAGQMNTDKKNESEEGKQEKLVAALETPT